MLKNGTIQPQLNPNDFSIIVNLLKPVLQEFSSVRLQPLSHLEKASKERAIFEKFIDSLQTDYQDDVLISFLSENWQKFMNDLETDKILEKLESDEHKVTEQTPSRPLLVQSFVDNLVLLFGLSDEQKLPLSGVDLVQNLYDRNKELKELETREKLKIKWLELFASKDLSAIGFDDLVNMIENLDLIISQKDDEFIKRAHDFFGKEVNLANITSKDIISLLKAKTNLKPAAMTKQQIVLRELLAWNKCFALLQKNKMPDEVKLAEMIHGWPLLIENLFSLSMEFPAAFSKTSSRFFKSVKKMFGVHEIPMTRTELVEILHQRIMLIEPEKLRKQFDLSLKRAAK